MKYKLNRFIKAQNKYYPIALKEIQAGKKENHWIWFIFPQLKGLGLSDNSKYYGISGIDEAKAYFQVNVLRARLREITIALLNQEQSNLVTIVGDVDFFKIQACMTLFYIATKEKCFREVLIKYFNGKLHFGTMKLLKMESYNIDKVLYEGL
jgi:uncharacterized protein (DUF1810 family)